MIFHESLSPRNFFNKRGTKDLELFGDFHESEILESCIQDITDSEMKSSTRSQHGVDFLRLP